ncbi:MAG TPA: hypothetical protein VE777_15105 [Gaiellales bacterium]|nr:hypothetical protein [Gaiellales bacterium]
MAETVAPVVHGVRGWLAGVAAFAAGAIAAGVALGWSLGTVAAAAGGGGAGGAWAAAAVAGTYAAREAGLVRLPVPQLRRQVPQSWREALPVPVAAGLYGAGLGVGFATYVPVATLVAVVAAVLLADPALGAVALGAFGAGRAAALVAATAGLETWDQAADRFERAGCWLRERGGRLRTANAAAMAALAGLLVPAAAPAPAAAAVQVDLGSTHVADPSAGPPGVLAWDVIRPSGLRGKIRVNDVVKTLPGFTPDVDGSRVVVDTGPAFEIVDTGTLAVIRTLHLKGDEPALSGRWLVYRQVTDRRRLILFDLQSGTSRVIESAKLRTDLGAPDISGSRVVYHLTGRRRSSVLLYRIDRRTTRVVKRTPIWSLGEVSVSGTTLAYVRQNLDGMAVWRLDLTTGAQVRLYRIRKHTGRFLWTTATNGRRCFFTVYTKSSSLIWHA